MLYLPPNMPHHGIAHDDDCMTLSIGFHAPSQHELIYDWVESVSNSPEFKQRYNDKSRLLQTHSAEISQYDIDQLSKLILEGIDAKKETLSLWLGKYLTETKGDSALNVETKIQQSQETQPSTSNYHRKSWLRLAYIEAKEGIHFFADGEYFLLKTEAKNAILYLCDNYIYKKLLIKQYSNQYPSFKFVFEKMRKNNIIT
jgi:50S ribosomal protein L16 3-hydroxylase